MMNDGRQADIHLRVMMPDDLPDCQELKQRIGWNQRLDDWRRFHALNPCGCFVAVHTTQIVGTVCTVAYQKCGWVAMVIVDPDYRRMGIGRLLLLKGIEHLEQRGLTVKLDATPQGKMLYDTLGFQDEYTGARYECGAAQQSGNCKAECQQVSKNDLDEITAFDREIFGDERRAVLASYLKSFPQYAFWIKEQNQMVGYLLAREGENAFHIGPWIALNEEAARSLFIHCIKKRAPERTFVDIISPNLGSEAIVRELGFTQQRPFIRMYRGKNSTPGKPQYIYGMSGPELG